MQEAEKQYAYDYDSFNAFFTRHLKSDARHWINDNKQILSPVDGAISQIGAVDDQRILQAKGKDYALEQLLAGDKDLASIFTAGQFATLYLSPCDYHRIHMPVSGKLLLSIYVPGRLFAVNNPAVRTLDAVFARNERFISMFDTDHGKLAMIMVGALFVGSMETVWEGQITPAKNRQLTKKYYPAGEIILEQGSEFGLFNMGSTVILLFEENKAQWLTNRRTGDKIQVGQLLGKACF